MHFSKTDCRKHWGQLGEGFYSLHKHCKSTSEVIKYQRFFISHGPCEFTCEFTVTSHTLSQRGSHVITCEICYSSYKIARTNHSGKNRIYSVLEPSQHYFTRKSTVTAQFHTEIHRYFQIIQNTIQQIQSFSC